LGATNRSGNVGTIARFGWTAQNKSLVMFSGEAYDVEMGVSTTGHGAHRKSTPATADPRQTEISCD